MIVNGKLKKMWKWLGHSLRYYSSIYLEGLRKTFQTLSQDNQCPKIWIGHLWNISQKNHCCDQLAYLRFHLGTWRCWEQRKWLKRNRETTVAGRQEETGDFKCINHHNIERVLEEMSSERKISPYHTAWSILSVCRTWSKAQRKAHPCIM
jgi:hypothetical protein